MNRTVLSIRLLIVVGVICLCANLIGVDAQQPLAANTRPFEPVEELLYEAEFSRSLLRGIDVAQFTFRSSRTPVADLDEPSVKEKSNTYSLIFNADVVSKGFFTRLFNLHFHEQMESIVDGKTFTLQRTTILEEQGKRTRSTKTIYDRSNGKMHWTLTDPKNPDAEPRKITADFSGQLQDVLSATYFIRTQPLQVGKSFEIFIGDGGRVYKVPVQVVKRKKMKTVIGTVKVLQVEPQLFGPENLIDGHKGEFILWVTDDQRHLVVRAKVKTEYGTFDIKLKKLVNNPPS